MVRSRASWWRNRSGKVKLGCLLQLVLVAGVGYYGFDWVTVYYKYWSFGQVMESQADLAAGIDDATIHRRLLVKIDALGLPDEAKRNIRIRRRDRPREIVISSSYVVQLQVPFRAPIERTLNPSARQALGNF